MGLVAIAIRMNYSVPSFKVLHEKFLKIAEAMSKMFLLGSKTIPKYDYARFFIILGSFLLLMVTRQIAGRFNFNLGYCYLMLTCLSGYWFGVRGGICAALASFGIFSLEVYLFPDWPSRAVVLDTSMFRLIFLIWSGLAIGAYSEIRKSKIENMTYGLRLPEFLRRAIKSPAPNKVALIVVLFALLILTRLFIGKFNFLLGYLYVTVICLSGFWFGFKGGVVSATLSITIFVIELSVYHNYPFAGMVYEHLYSRIFFFYLSGIASGLVYESERKFNSNLAEYCYYDELTKAVSYRWIMFHLDKEVSRAKRYGKEISVIMIDLDDFKIINDKVGHVMGNRILQTFVAVVKDNLRKEDLIARYGGEEFLIVLPECNASAAQQVISKIIKSVSEDEILSMLRFNKIETKTTFSAGIAVFPEHGDTVIELIQTADNALYQAKREGKNRAFVERRKNLRMAPPSNLVVEILGQSIPQEAIILKVENISQRGLLINAPFDLNSKGKRITCRLSLFSKAMEIENIGCKIVRCNKINDSFITGLVFSGVSELVKNGISIPSENILEKS